MEHIIIRDICEEDKERYFKLQKEIWISPQRVDKDRAQIWKMKLEDEQINCAIMDGKTVYGFCGIKKEVETYPEVEIEILKEYIHRGIGYKALTLLLEKSYHEKGFQTFIAKVSPDNYPSILLFRKVGAKPAGLKRNIVIDEKEIKEYEIKNRELITENLKAVAWLFQVEAASLLTHNLLFQVELPLPKVPQFDLELKGDLQYTKNIERCVHRYHNEYLIRELTKIKDQINNNDENNITESMQMLLSKMESIL